MHEGTDFDFKSVDLDTFHTHLLHQVGYVLFVDLALLELEIFQMLFSFLDLFVSLNRPTDKIGQVGCSVLVQRVEL